MFNIRIDPEKCFVTVPLEGTGEYDNFNMRQCKNKRVKKTPFCKFHITFFEKMAGYIQSISKDEEKIVLKEMAERKMEDEVHLPVRRIIWKVM